MGKGTIRILIGDCRDVLASLPDQSVHCCVTSPPYFGLRDYGAERQIGLEETPDQYVAEIVQVFREVWRVLRNDGTVWLNLGDSYAGSGKGIMADGSFVGGMKQRTNKGSILPAGSLRPSYKVGEGLKSKDLIGIPWLVAFALRADGWYLRSDIVWAKPNPMPESVTDRPTKSHEFVFLLSKSERYFYDHEAIKEPCETDEGRPPGIVRDREYGYDSKEAVVRRRPSVKRGDFNGKSNTLKGREAFRAVTSTRNKRDVWEVQSRPFLEAHFATFPPDLIKPCVLAGTSPQACEVCGTPWVRVLGDRVETGGNGSGNLERKFRQDYGGPDSMSHQAFGIPWTPGERPTIGWQAACECENVGAARCVVLDPFGGAGTTGLVCEREGRDAVLIEINPEFAAMSDRRIRNDAPLFASEVIMTDEYARPPHVKPATEKTSSTAPLVDEKMKSTVVSGEGVDDHPDTPASAKTAADPKRPA